MGDRFCSQYLSSSNHDNCLKFMQHYYEPRHLKYIVAEDMGIDMAIVFNSILNHADVARGQRDAENCQCRHVLYFPFTRP